MVHLQLSHPLLEAEEQQGLLPEDEPEQYRHGVLGTAPIPGHNHGYGSHRSAGKGKPRRDAPRGGARDRAPDQDSEVSVGAQAEGDAGPRLAPSTTHELVEHPQVKRDLRRLTSRQRDIYADRIEAMLRGERHPSQHPLHGKLKGWDATDIDGQARITHRFDGEDLLVGHVGPHTYDLAAQRLGVTENWPPYLTEREDEFGDRYPVNVSRANHRGPVGTVADAQAAGLVGPYFHGTSRARARQIRAEGFRQPRLHNWEMANPGTAEEVDLGHTHRTFFAETRDAALRFARAHHGDDADVVTAYLHPDHIEHDKGGGWMPSATVKDVAHAMAIAHRKQAASGLTLHPTGRAFNRHIDEFDVRGHQISVPEEEGWSTRVRFERSSHPDLNHRIVVTQERPAPLQGTFGRDVGRMSYHSETGRVEGIQTHENFARRGIATGMWDLAKRLHEQYGTVALMHSKTQTPEGRAWAQRNAALNEPGTPTELVKHLEGRQDLYQPADGSGHPACAFHALDDQAFRRRLHEFGQQVKLIGPDESAPDEPALRQVGRGRCWDCGNQQDAATRYAPRGQQVEKRPTTRSPYHSDEHRFWDQPERKDEAMPFAPLPQSLNSARTFPHARVFGPTYGLDHRLWTPEGKLRPEIRRDLLRTFTGFCARHGYRDWASWARIDFFGSEASRWTSPTLEGNGDFDTNVAINFPAFRKANPAFAHQSATAIAALLTQQMHDELNDPQKTFPGIAGTYDQTWFSNAASWVIENIRPYAAYSVSDDRWLVEPPDLPNFDVHQLPHAVLVILQAAATTARNTLKLPEPERTLQAARLYDMWHTDRSNAFGPQGAGQFDLGNLREKTLDQLGIWGELAKAHHDAQGMVVPDWHNDPAAIYRTARLPEKQQCGYCDNQATRRVIHSEGMAYVPACDDHLDRAKDDAARCTPDGSPDPSNINAVRKIAVLRHLSEFRQLISNDHGVSVPHIRDELQEEYRRQREDARYLGLDPDDPESIIEVGGHYIQAHAGGPDRYIEKLKRSIAERGLTHPPEIADTDRGRLIGDGNHRAVAIHELGIDPVPVNYTGDYRSNTKTASADTDLLDEIGRREHPNVDQYRSGGMGHLEGDESKSVVGFMPVREIVKYREHGGDWNGEHSRETVDKIRQDIRDGVGIRTPLMVEHNPDLGWGYLGEGNHRLRAAQEEGLKTVPVRVARSYGSVERAKANGIGAPMRLQRSLGEDAFGEPYVPSDIHPYHFLRESVRTAATERAQRAWGSHDLDALFGDAPTTATPFRQAGRSKDRKDYDPELIRQALTDPQEHHLQLHDPRELRATQPSITRSGVQYYLTDEYRRTGRTFADQHNLGNRHPVVYRREDGQSLLLSGHHRAAVALLRGEPLQAVTIDGPWGPSRREGR